MLTPEKAYSAIRSLVNTDFASEQDVYLKTNFVDRKIELQLPDALMSPLLY